MFSIFQCDIHWVSCQFIASCPECILQYMFCEKQQITFKRFLFEVRTMLGFLTAGCWRDTARQRGFPWNFYQKSGVGSMAVRSSHRTLHHPWMYNAVSLQYWSLIRQKPFCSILYLETRALLHSHGLKSSYLHLHWDSHYKPTLPAADLASCLQFHKEGSLLSIRSSPTATD